MKKIILGILIFGVALSVKAQTPTPIPLNTTTYITGVTTNSTPITIANTGAPVTTVTSGQTVISNVSFIDFADIITNSNAAGVTGRVVITSGGVTVSPHSPAAGNGGWATMMGWPYPAPLNNNRIVLIDVSGIGGIEYSFKLFRTTDRGRRPQ